MVSAFLMVDSLCAITKLVRPAMSLSMARWMRHSVRVSTFEVASSKMRMGLSARTARAMVKSWRWPWEMFVAPSSNSKS